jgi:hypothetical protein
MFSIISTLGIHSALNRSKVSIQITSLDADVVLALAVAVAGFRDLCGASDDYGIARPPHDGFANAVD